MAYTGCGFHNMSIVRLMTEAGPGLAFVSGSFKADGAVTPNGFTAGLAIDDGYNVFDLFRNPCLCVIQPGLPSPDSIGGSCIFNYCVSQSGASVMISCSGSSALGWNGLEAAGTTYSTYTGTTNFVAMGWV